MLIQLHEKHKSHDSFRMERIMFPSSIKDLVILYSLTRIIKVTSKYNKITCGGFSRGMIKRTLIG